MEAAWLLHTGEATEDREGFFRRSVILTARVAAQAAGEQILVSSLLKALVESTGKFQFGEAQEVELKGLARAHPASAKWHRARG